MNELDSWVQPVDGMNYRVRVVADFDATPHEYDCYTESQVTAWKNDEWQFAGVVVSPEITGLDAEWFDASLWAVEYGDLPAVDQDGNLTGETYDSTAYIRDDVVPELARQCWSQRGTVTRLAELRDALTRILLIM